MPSDACSEVWLRDLEKVNPEVIEAPENQSLYYNFPIIRKGYKK